MVVREAYVSYHASDFEATARFYEDVIGLERVTGWDRSDRRGAYFGRNGLTVVEISASAVDEPALAPPAPDGGLAVTLMVDDVDAALAEIVRRGGSVDGPVIRREWGRYFGVRDPDGLPVYLMQRLGPSADAAREFLTPGHRSR